MADTESTNSNSASDKSPSKNQGLWRDLSAYWILGLCN